jgi:hypothetical protein
MDEQLTAASAARVGELLALLEPLGVPVGATSLSEIAQRIQQLSVAEAIEAGFSFAGPSDHIGERQVFPSGPAGLPRGAFTLMLPPGGGHRALLWHVYAADALRLWIDARDVALPADARGASLAEPPGGWADEWFFSIEVIPADHPAQDWSRPTGRGQIRGLLVCDALARHEQTVLPQAHEIWTYPQLRVLDDRVRLYADGAAYDADRPAREWPLG